jgi:hypothetical protein
MEPFKLSRGELEVPSMSTSEADYRWLGIDVSKDRLDVYDPSQSLNSDWLSWDRG